MSMKNSSDTIGDLTHDLPTCSAVPQPTALRRTPILADLHENFTDFFLDRRLKSLPSYFHMIKKTSLHLFGTNVISHFPCLLHLHFLFLSSSPEMNFLPIQMKKAFSQGHFLQCWFLGAFAKLRKRLSASSYLSVRPQKTTRLPLEGFPWKSMFEHFRKSATNKLKFFF